MDIVGWSSSVDGFSGFSWDRNSLHSGEVEHSGEDGELHVDNESQSPTRREIQRSVSELVVCERQIWTGKCYLK